MGMTVRFEEAGARPGIVCDECYRDIEPGAAGGWALFSGQVDRSSVQPGADPLACLMVPPAGERLTVTLLTFLVACSDACREELEALLAGLGGLDRAVEIPLHEYLGALREALVTS